MTSISDSTRSWAEQRTITHYFAAQTGSTNDDAKKNAGSESDDFTFYVATHQSAGRGRGSNTWLDTGHGDSLLSTWSFALTQSPQAISAPRIGLALHQAAAASWPALGWSLKAPNDLLLNGQKVGGLLVETISHGAHYRLLIGLGLNVLNFPRLVAGAACLASGLKRNPEEGEWFHFLDELRTGFLAALPECTQATLTSSTRKRLQDALNANPGKPFSITDISPEGDLLHAQGRVPWIRI